MNRVGQPLAASISALGLMPLAQAQTGTTAEPGATARGVVITDYIHARAQVQAIDCGERTVVLKWEDGNTITPKATAVGAIDPQTRELTLTVPRGDSQSFGVGEVVRNLDQIRKGDVVLYTGALALSVEKS